jgi:hypothetical protein
MTLRMSATLLLMLGCTDSAADADTAGECLEDGLTCYYSDASDYVSPISYQAGTTFVEDRPDAEYALRCESDGVTYDYLRSWYCGQYYEHESGAFVGARCSSDTDQYCCNSYDAIWGHPPEDCSIECYYRGEHCDPDYNPNGAKCESGTTIEFPDVDDPVSLYLDGLQFVTAEENVSDVGFGDFRAYTCDYATLTVLNIVQVVDDTYVWDEEHELDLSVQTEATADVPPWERWQKTLTHVDSVEDLGIGMTLFNTEDDPGDGTHGNLTYVVRIYNDAADVQDCAVWGSNVDFVLAGFESTNDTPTSSSIGNIPPDNCADLTP